MPRVFSLFGMKNNTSSYDKTSLNQNNGFSLQEIKIKNIYMEDQSEFFNFKLSNEGNDIADFLKQIVFWENTNLYLHEKGIFFSAQGKNLRIVLTDLVQPETQMMFGDIKAEHFISSSVGTSVDNNEIILYLHLDHRLKDKHDMDEILNIAKNQIAQRIYMMIDYKTVQEKMNGFIKSSLKTNFFYE